MPVQWRTPFGPLWPPALVLLVLCMVWAAASNWQATTIEDEQPAGQAAQPRAAESLEEEPGKKQSSENLIINGGFEEQSATRPWYYIRWGGLVERSDAPDNSRCLQFESGIPGLEAQAQQTVRLEGRRLFAVRLSVSVRGEELAPGQSFEQQAACQIVFYDQGHKPIGGGRVGPWQGTFNWTRYEVVLPVPRRARVAIVWIGLMGGTGRAWFDDIALEPAEVNPSIFTPP